MDNKKSSNPKEKSTPGQWGWLIFLVAIVLYAFGVPYAGFAAGIGLLIILGSFVFSVLYGVEFWTKALTKFINHDHESDKNK